MHGAPALPPEFTHLPYADPKAPKGGRIAFGPVVSLTLSGDHRLVDVVAGAAFLAEVRRRLEEPRLLLGSHV